MYLSIIPSVVVPESHDGGVIERPYPIDIKGSLYFLYDDLGILVSVLVLLVLLRIIVVLSSVQLVPFGKVDAVVVGAVA